MAPAGAATRLVVPQLETLARGISAAQLQSVRWQVEPGDIVAVYRAGRVSRILLVGPERLRQVAPASLAPNWRLVGTVEITDDGERALPVVLS